MELLDKEFNLLDEPWIRVLLPGYEVKEVSLTDVLLHSHEYLALAGELPTQDIAVLRLLLAVLHSVYYRVDENGCENPVQTPDDAYSRWVALWNRGCFQDYPIYNYLDMWRDRFWLFHPERPFWQSPAAIIGTSYSAAKLNGEISESNNKDRLTPTRTGPAKHALTYAEAARWLIHLNAFDDTSAKPKGKNLPSSGAGWLGKLGLVAAKGDNLFETLLLNFVLLQPDGSVWAAPEPVWELPVGRNEERVKVTHPKDQASLLTLQSRRLLLVRERDSVIGCTLLGGDFFDKEGSFVEQMTTWKPVYDKGKAREIIGYQPKRHIAARQAWREFSSFVGYEKNSLRPGVLTWNSRLQAKRYLDRNRTMLYQIVSVQYGDKDFFVTDMFSDSISFHAEMLSDLGRLCCKLVSDEIEYCDKIAWYIGDLASELCYAAGGEGKNAAWPAGEKFYYNIDVPFRKWLVGLDPDGGAEDLGVMIEEWRAEWRKISLRIALDCAKELIRETGSVAFVGRTVSQKKGNSTIERHYSAPEAYNHFLYRLNSLNETG